MIQMGKIFADRYMVEREIGRGGMANVFLATDRFLDNRPVAVKVLRSTFENDTLAIARFQREAYAMAELSHPNIVSILDVGEHENQQYIVMEYVDGITLKQYIKQNAPLSNDDATDKISGILSAMAVAHTRGIIHRDLKPQNILVAENGEIKVTDFGIAKALGESSLTQTNSMFGSVHYLSPEQARGANATIQSDIYAIGIMLFELLTGRMPFDGDSAVSIALKHFQESLPSIININPNVPQALENVVIKATAKSIKYRYKDVMEMLTDLGTALSLDRRGEAKLVLPKDDMGNIAKSPIPVGDTQELIRQVTAQGQTPEENVKKNPVKSDSGDVTKKPKRSKRGLIIGALILLALLVGGGGMWAALNSGADQIAVPSVAGQSQSTAESTLKSAGFQIGAINQENSSSVDKGTVIKTDPAANATAKKGSKVALYVSKGAATTTVTMPSLTDSQGNLLTEAQMRTQLANLGVPDSSISTQTVETTDQTFDKLLSSTTPSQGTTFDPSKTKILLTVFSFKAPSSSSSATPPSSSAVTPSSSSSVSSSSSH